MRHLLYLMFRCDVDVMESLELGGVFLELNTALDVVTNIDKCACVFVSFQVCAIYC